MLATYCPAIQQASTCARLRALALYRRLCGWHVYLGVEVAALLHKRADRKPEAVGQGELVDGSRQGDVVAVGVQGAHVTTLIASWPPPSGAKFQGQLHEIFSNTFCSVLLRASN